MGDDGVVFRIELVGRLGHGLVHVVTLIGGGDAAAEAECHSVVLVDVDAHISRGGRIVGGGAQSLAAFALAGNYELVTFDKGFARYPGLTTTLLS